MDAYPPEWIDEAVAFLHKFRARFASAPAVRDEFLALLTGLAGGGGGGDAGAVVARANEILAGHPDLLSDFRAFLRGGTADVPAAADGRSLAASRPRRSVREKDDDGSLGGAAADDRGAGGAAAQDDARLPEAVEFTWRVRQRAGAAAYAAFVAVVRAAAADESMDAHAIYDGVKEALGPAHCDLLESFAAVYLPGKAEWEEQEARRRRRLAKRKHAASSNAGAADADTPTTAAKSKKPLAGDDSHRHTVHGGESPGGGRASARRQHCKSLNLSWPQETVAENGKEQLPRQLADHGGKVLVFKAKNNVPDDGKVLGFKAKNNVPDDGKVLVFKAKNNVPHDGKVLGFKAKKNVPHDGKVLGFKAKNGNAVAGDSSHRQASRTSKEASGSKAEARVQDGGDKKPCRRAKNGEGSSAAVAAAAALSQEDREALRFRRMWEFETGYSRLLATMARAEELLHGGAHAGDGSPRSVEELFPSRECREFLQHCYGKDAWRYMRIALERGGACAGMALESMLQRLREKEAAAVEDARMRKREDPVRAAKRLSTLATCGLDKERRRRNAGGGGG